MRLSKTLFLFALLLLISTACSPHTISKIVGGKVDLKNSAVTVPFVVDSGAIIVPVRLNDSEETLRFMVHTNAFSAVSIETAKKYNIEKLFSVVGKVATGEVKDIDVGSVEKLEVGNGVVQTKTPIGILDLSPLELYAGVKVDGMIGNNFLRMFEVTIDYRYERLIFQLPYSTNIDSIIPGRGLYVMPFNISVKEWLSPKIAGKVNGLVRTEFIIDTGNLGDTFLTHNTASYLGYLEKYSEHKMIEVYGVPIGGYTGLYQQPLMSRLDSIDFGSMHIGPHLFLAAQGDANRLGYSVLRNYRITLNYEKAIAVFREWRKKAQLNERMFSCGLAIGIKDGEYVIIGLAKGSEAEQKGLRPFDIVQEVNGQIAKKIGLAKINEILSDQSETIDLLVQGHLAPMKLKKADLLSVEACIVVFPHE